MTSTPSTARSSTEYSWLRRFAARRPLTAFLVLGMSLGYTLALVWGLAYNGVIPRGGLADALHIAPDELVGAATLLALFPAALLVTWANDGRTATRRNQLCCVGDRTVDGVDVMAGPFAPVAPRVAHCGCLRRRGLSAEKPMSCRGRGSAGWPRWLPRRSW